MARSNKRIISTIELTAPIGLPSFPVHAIAGPMKDFQILVPKKRLALSHNQIFKSIKIYLWKYIQRAIRGHVVNWWLLNVEHQ